MESTYDPEPLLVLRVRGTQAEMGAQLGELWRGLPGADRTMEFYARMASSMLGLAAPHAVRAPARRALQAAMGVGTTLLHRARRRRFPAYVARTEALMRALGKPVALARHLAVMDVLQNTVGLAGSGTTPTLPCSPMRCRRSAPAPSPTTTASATGGATPRAATAPPSS